LHFPAESSFNYKGRPQKERLKNFFSSLKNVCVHVKKTISFLRSSLLPFLMELSLLALSNHLLPLPLKR
jgi:hypothetical protein